MTLPRTLAEFQAASRVSTGVLTRLEAYVALLQKWQRKINLVGAASLADVWRRHILDSAQLGPHLPENAKIIADIGSGAGLPGLVLAIAKTPREAEFHLIESNGRKCAFLEEANRITGACAVLHHGRAEEITNIKADGWISRGVAKL